MSGKGGEFERYISKQLTLWLTGKKKPYAFWRMPASGALATIYEGNEILSGDIIGISEEAKFFTNRLSIEAKTGYPSTSVWQHFKDIKNFGIKLFWQQCVGDALNAGKIPMLIYRKKGRQIITGIRRLDFEKYTPLSKLPSMSIKFRDDELPEVVFFDFVQFLEKLPPNQLKGYLK